MGLGAKQNDYIFKIIGGIKKLKQKHENSSLEITDNFDKQVIAYEESIVKAYLDKNTFTVQIEEKERELYEFNRKIMGESLDEKTRQNPILAALIERIARNTILLERFEKSLILTDGLDKVTDGKAGIRGSNYVTLLEQHRKCIETFCNVKWAYDQKKPKKTLELLRQTISEEDA